MTEEPLYDVFWEGPWPIAEAKPASGHVLYQLTGMHYAYGADQLLYIGQTQRAHASARLWEHVRAWAADEADHVSVRLGSIGVFENWDGWRANTAARYEPAPDAEIVTAIERLLIYVHQPAYNSREKTRARGLPVGTCACSTPGCIVACCLRLAAAAT